MSADSHGTNADEPSAPSSPTWRRYVTRVVGLLPAFGIFAAVGGRIVDELFPAAAEKVRGGGALRITAREDPHGGSDGFEVATRVPAGLDPALRRASSCDSLLTAAKHPRTSHEGEIIRYFRTALPAAIRGIRLDPSSAPSWIRTSGLPLRRGTLCPAELSGPARRAAGSHFRDVYAMSHDPLKRLTTPLTSAEAKAIWVSHSHGMT
jgi:hypothetical protein